MSNPRPGHGRFRKDITNDLAVRIFDHIKASDLAPGTHLPAQEIADLFNVSRSPVTQALNLLAQKKIVTHMPNYGFYVSATEQLDAHDLNLVAKDDLTPVYFRIVDDHLRGVLGNQASERSLRQRYNLTKGEVSELLNRMAREGWAERRPGYGWNFASVLTTPKALEQSYRLRIVVEPAGLLEPTFDLPRALAEQARERERRLLAGEIETLSPDALYEHGVRYHETLAEASGNPFFLDTLRRINRMRRLFTYRTMVDRSRYYGQVREHIRILDLLIEGRNNEAAAAMRSHLEEVLKNVRSIKFIEPQSPEAGRNVEED